jgi:hypothetical protein
MLSLWEAAADVSAEATNADAPNSKHDQHGPRNPGMPGYYIATADPCAPMECSLATCHKAPHTTKTARNPEIMLMTALPASVRPPLSQVGWEVLSEIIAKGLEGPRILHQAWTNGTIPDTDLYELIPAAWQRVKSPEREIGADNWLPMFRAVGLITPPHMPLPSTPKTVYRGSTFARARGMSWTPIPESADDLRQWHTAHGPTAVFRATAPPESLLAIFYSGSEGWDIIVDPSKITDFGQHSQTYPQQPTAL